jgi:hypothetical protein
MALDDRKVVQRFGMSRLSSDQIESLIDTLCKAFWHKRPFSDFLRRCGVSANDLSELGKPSTSTKREFLRWLFQRYESSPAGNELMRGIALSLAAKTVFPDLDPSAIGLAKLAIQGLRELFPAVKVNNQTHHGTHRAAANECAKPIDLTTFKRSFLELLPSMGTADAGRRFEDWFVQLATAFSLRAKGKYRTADRELDGSLQHDAFTYVLELKFTGDKTDASDVSNFRDKVMGHAAGTLGLLVSVSGYTQNALSVANRAASPVILLDGAHLFQVIEGQLTLNELIDRVRRHAIETGVCYWPTSEMAATHRT